MTRKLIDWFLRNVLLGSIPLITELVIRWAAGTDVLTSEKNIPELMFLVAMVNLGTADDIEHARDTLKEANPVETRLKESLTNWHNLLMFGTVISSALFGGYLVVDTLGTTNKHFLSHFLTASWVITCFYFALATIAKIFTLNNAPKEGIKQE